MLNSLDYSQVKQEFTSSYAGTVSCDFTKNGCRLPTEAEWEFAARGGNKSAADWNYTYAGSNKINDVAWHASYSDFKTHEVKKKEANGLELYDMSGNVCEWCWDWYGSSIKADTSATGPLSGSTRVKRGGSCFDMSDYCSVSYWGNNSPSYCDNNLGFRLFAL